MTTPAGRILKSDWRKHSTFPIVLLVLLYLIGSVQLESFHSLLHASEETALHSSDKELDPCHISIYHQERDGACAHKTHVSGKHTCPLCHGIFHTDHLLLSTCIQSDIAADSFARAGNQLSKAKAISLTLPARAPPVL
jgi:hypothetical protein